MSRSPRTRDRCDTIQTGNFTSDEGTTDGTIETADITSSNGSSTSTSGHISVRGYGALLDVMPVEDVVSDVDLLFTKETSDVNTQNENWEDELLHLGRVITQRESSEDSELTTASLENSTGSMKNVKLKEEEGSRLTKSWSEDRAQSAGSDKSNKLYDWSVGSTQSADLEKINALYEWSVDSAQSPDSEKINTSYDWRVDRAQSPDPETINTLYTLDKPCYVSPLSFGNEELEIENLDRKREDLETQLIRQTASVEKDQLQAQPPHSPPLSPVTMKLSPKSRSPSHSPPLSPVTMKFSPQSKSFLAPVPNELHHLRAIRLELGTPTQSNLSTTVNPNDAGSLHILPMNKDASLEKTLSASVLPTNLFTNLDLPDLEIRKEDNEPHPPIDNKICDVPTEIGTNLHETHVKSSRPTVIPTDLFMDWDSFSQEIPHEDDELRRSIEDVLCDIPHQVDDELRRLQTNINTRSTNSSSGCVTISPGTSAEDVGFMLRSRRLDAPYQRLDDTMMEDQSHTSTNSSYHFVNLPLELQNDHKAMNVDDNSDRDSEVATASSDEDITHREELHSDILGDEEKDMCTLYRSSSISSNEEESDLSSGALSMLGLFKDVESCHSSVTSFDSIEFLEDEQSDDGKSKTYCSVSMHLGSIHEENEDDIAEEVSLSPEEDERLSMDQNLLPMPLNGELLLQKTSTLGTGTGRLSSVTDDSYFGSTSFDSFSSVSERVNRRGFYCKATGWKDGINIDMSSHEDFANEQTLYKPSHQQQFNDESSQVTFESSLLTFADSTCSYDSFSSQSVKQMSDMLREETGRRRSKMKDRIAKMRESNEKVSYATEYVSSLVKGR